MKKHWREFSLWEEATKAPLMMVVPGLTRADSVCDTPVDFMNIYPTLADLCGLPLSEQLDGVSMRRLLEDVNADWDRVAMTTDCRGSHAVRTRRWRYIRYADGSEELYDHDADPMEWKNVAGDSQFSSVKTRLAKSMPTGAERAPESPYDARLRRQHRRPGKSSRLFVGVQAFAGTIQA